MTDPPVSRLSMIVLVPWMSNLQQYQVELSSLASLRRGPRGVNVNNWQPRQSYLKAECKLRGLKVYRGRLLFPPSCCFSCHITRSTAEEWSPQSKQKRVPLCVLVLVRLLYVPMQHSFEGEKEYVGGQRSGKTRRHLEVVGFHCAQLFW